MYSHNKVSILCFSNDVHHMLSEAHAMMRSYKQAEEKRIAHQSITEQEFEISFHYSRTMENHLWSTWLDAKLA